jgi:hypothetical protein
MWRLFVFWREDKDNIGYANNHPYKFFTYKEMKKRLIITWEYTYRYTTLANPKYTYMEEHYILRPRETNRDKRIVCSVTMSDAHKKELPGIFDVRNRDGFHVYINPNIYRSVEKYHIHLCKWKILDSIW